jgi:hypothetical protein
MAATKHDADDWTEQFEFWTRHRHRESSSGDGSTIAATQEVRRALELIFSGAVLDDDVRSLLDLPCGDWNWMRLVDLSNVAYTGADVVRPLIDRNRRLFGRNGIEFVVFDLLNSAAVPGSHDIALCRDFLGHFTPQEGVEMLAKLAAASRYVLVTTFPSQAANDHAERSWYPCNLERAPFRLPKPLRLMPEQWVSGKCLGLWRSADVRAALREPLRNLPAQGRRNRP